MSKYQRSKGAAYEREIAQLFTDVLSIPDVEFKRNIGQARDGGNDLDIGPLVVEAKRRQQLKTLYKWMEQAEDAAERRWRANKAGLPVVVTREDAGENLVVMKLEDFFVVAADYLRDEILAQRERDGR